MKRGLPVLVATWLMSVPAHAVPVAYTIAFDPTNSAAGGQGPVGVGSFLYDAATSPYGTLTGFMWDFGSGSTGGFTDAMFAIDDVGQWVFRNILQNLAVNPNNGASLGPITVATSFLDGPFPGRAAALCWGSLSSTCHMLNPMDATPSYEFIGTDEAGRPTAYRGYMTIKTATVPEPGTLILLSGGLFGLAVARRRTSLVA